ncbi:MAG: glycosyltransferase, partial [Actinomycetota bacterium]|nr:glycosyltransferase [Actinomycetota bacterium]
MSAPRVSVIVPARDAEATLPRALAGLAEQEPGDGLVEVIVVDNGSRDETAALASGSAVVTRVIRRARGEGPGAARNA